MADNYNSYSPQTQQIPAQQGYRQQAPQQRYQQQMPQHSSRWQPMNDVTSTGEWFLNLFLPRDWNHPAVRLGIRFRHGVLEEKLGSREPHLDSRWHHSHNRHMRRGDAHGRRCSGIPSSLLFLAIWESQGSN